MPPLQSPCATTTKLTCFNLERGLQASTAESMCYNHQADMLQLERGLQASTAESMCYNHQADMLQLERGLQAATKTHHSQK